MRIAQFAWLAELSYQKKNPGKPLFARVEKLIHEIGLGAHAPRKQKLKEKV
jgi:hypothetical protein